MIGCYFDRFHAEWSEAEITLFETMIEEEDVDIMAWALGTQSIPEEYRGPLLDRMMKLDYVGFALMLRFPDTFGTLHGRRMKHTPEPAQPEPVEGPARQA